jgi:protein gp37
VTAISKIEWTDATWNPLRGCSRVSEGCARCYAEGIARRFSGPGKPYEGLIHSTGRWNGKIRLAENHLLDPIRWSKARRIFVNSMSDLFHEAVPFEYIDKVFAVMACTTRHTYQVLTKRPERMLEYFSRLRWNVALYDALDGGNTFDQQLRWHSDGHDFTGLPDQISPGDVYDEWKPNRGKGGYDNCGPTWPLVNVWLGVSCENQATADQRIPLLLKVPAAVRFLSCEPLLGPISFEGRWVDHPNPVAHENWLDKIDWLICGGESGHKSRPMEIDLVRSLKDQCAAVGTAFFMKQGARANWYDFKNFDSFPADLQVREWPTP